LKIVKVFNNSVVLCRDERDREVVLFGRGLGYQKGAGSEVDEDLVEKRFVPGGATSVDRLAAYLQDLPSQDIDLAEEVLALARLEFGAAVSEQALFPLADHLSFAFRRLRDEIPMDYALHWEVASLYPREFAFAQRMVLLMRERRGVLLPDLEAVPLALHFVNSQFGAGEMSETVRITAALTAVLQTALREGGTELAEDSVDIARFVTHVRYLILRRMTGQRPAKVDPFLGSAVRLANPRAHAVAGLMAKELSGRFGWDVGDDERFFLALHASRFIQPEPS
jgi:beta-glucoside operon transcriptional antiterminator